MGRRRGLTRPRSEPRLGSRRRDCSPGCEGRRRPPTVTTPVAIYLQDAHPLREAMGWAQAAERAGFDAVWQAGSLLVRQDLVALAAERATDVQGQLCSR